MPTPCRALGAATLLASLVAPLAAQEAAEVCKSIGHVTVGQWASYDATGSKGGGKVRFAIVGSERRGDTTLYWFEISGAGTGQSGVVQILVPGFDADVSGIRGMIVKTQGHPAMRMPEQMAAMMGQETGQNTPVLDIARRCGHAKVVGWETVKTPGGETRALHLQDADGEAWLARDVPFGIVKASGKNGELMLTGKGTDAKSSITEKPQEMPGMMLPKPWQPPPLRGARLVCYVGAFVARPRRLPVLARITALVALAASLSPARPARAQAAPYDSTVFAALKWREIGIFRGGRSVAVAGSASRPNEYWMGTTGGGVFKTTDGGNTWLPVTDKYFGGTIGAIGVSESNPDVVYVGTGEYPIRGNVSHGDGVWKTTDGGRTWTHVGLEDTHQISRVRVHPGSPDTVWVGAQGHAFGPNADRGVYKTTDGGKTWRNVLFRNDSTGISDLVLDPSNAPVLHQASWQAQRKPWTLVSGGVGSGLFKSTDAGEHWTELTKNPGLPTGLWGNIGIAVSPAKPARVWALIEADSGGVYRSDDGGATWRYVNGERKLRQRPGYYSRIFADPKDTNTVYALNVLAYKSTDGGVTFKVLPDPHGDNHDMWIASNDPQRMIEGNDGGANVSFNGGKTWSDQDYATAQFYHVTTTNHFPYRVCGAQQDNSGVCGPSRWPGGIDRAQWYDVAGESGHIQARPDDPDITYGGDNSGFLARVDHKTGLWRSIDPWHDRPDGHPAGEGKIHCKWTATLFH